MEIKKIAMYGKQKPEPEITQGGYKSFGQAIGQYLSPEGSEPNTIRRFLSNIANSAREITGTDDESLAENQANYGASLQQVRNIGRTDIDPREKNRIDSMANRWGTNMASNVGAVAPISKAVRAQNLARFMEGSKVQEPVYHGTNKDISSFNGGKIFLTNNPKTASGYGEKIYELQLGIKNPLVVNGFGKRANRVNIPDELYDFAKKEYPNRNWDFQESEEFSTDQIVSLIKKYMPDRDGVVFRQLDDPAYNGAMSDNRDNIYVAFSPTQIKSATGNRGTFDPNDPNILHGIGLAGSGGSRDDKKSKMSMYAK